MQYQGLKVIVSPDKPKMVLAPDVMVSDSVRSEVNVWMLSFFGFDNILEDGVVMHVEHLKVVYVNPRTYAALQRELAKHSALENPHG